MDERRKGEREGAHPSSARPFAPSSLRPFLFLLFLLLAAPACGTTEVDPGDEDLVPEPVLNLAHLDYLGEEVARDGVAYRIVHIYADAPSYAWVGDADEGVACVDDAARAAVVYLRHYEETGEEASRQKAEALLRFVMYMQKDDGLFYNFVWNSALDINTTHQNSRADAFEFWAARGVWALGTCARVLETSNAPLAEACARRVRLTYPHLDALLANYPQTTQRGGRTYPRWLIHEFASDATSELVLGLVALDEAYPDPTLRTRIARFAEGIALMQYGSMNTFPYAAHASWEEQWHGWGNSQTQALAEAGHLESALREAESFYPRLLVDGWLHSFVLTSPAGAREFEQIAYATRGVAVGLVRLYEATGQARYLQLAGLAASWFTGNNAAGVAMYDPEHGYGYDGINSPQSVNRNAGAESTVEANFTILEVERFPEARRWMWARGEAPVHAERAGKQVAYRVFTAGEGDAARRLAVVMHLAEGRLDLLEGDALTAFLEGA